MSDASNVADEQWSIVEPLLPTPSRRGRRRRVNRRGYRRLNVSETGGFVRGGMTDEPAAPHDTLYKRHRFPAEIISHAVWLSFRFPLSLHHVEDLLAERGSQVPFQTAAKWAGKFGGEYAHRIRRSKGYFSDKWHLDKMVATIKNKKHWLWRPVDAEGYVFELGSLWCGEERADAGS